MRRLVAVLSSLALAVSSLAVIGNSPALAADPASQGPLLEMPGAHLPPGSLLAPGAHPIPAPSGEAPVGPLVYAGNCAGYNNLIYFVYRTSLTFTGSRGQATIRNGLSACSGASQTGVSLVNLANIQGNSNLAQCFMGQVTGYAKQFWYTPLNNGQLGNFNNQPRYQVGDTIQCVITAYGSNQWQYTLTNLTTGGSTTAYSSRGGTGGNEAWWGYEVYNDADEMGGDSGSTISLTYPGYQYSGGGTGWFYAAGDSVGSTAWGTMRSYWHGSVTGSPQDTVSAYTDNH